jgi:centromeric protein E
MEMKKISDEIKGKKRQIASLEREIAHATLGSQGKADELELSPVMFYICFGCLLSLY